MSITYNPARVFADKDTMGSTNPAKVLRGGEFDTEFNSIKAAFQLAAPSLNAALTGTTTAVALDVSGALTAGSAAVTGALTAGTVNGTTTSTWDATSSTVTAKEAGWDATKAKVDADSAGWDTTDTVVSAGAVNWDAAYDDKVNSASFNTGTGVLTLNQQDGGTVTASLEGRYSTTDTTYTGGTNITLSGTTFNLDSSLTGLTDVTTSAVSIGSWEIKLDGNDIRFVYAGVDKMRLTTGGALITSGDITATGAP